MTNILEAVGVAFVGLTLGLVGSTIAINHLEAEIKRLREQIKKTEEACLICRQDH